MTFDAFIETAWNDHADRPQEVADRLAASLPLVTSPAHIAPFARLVTHVFGEHLGQWQRGIALLESLRGRPAFDGGADATRTVSRNVAALRYADGDGSALPALPLEDQVVALATAASAFAGRGEFKGALAAYAEALRRMDGGVPAGSPAFRALAIGGNNLAAALEEKPDRDAELTRGMVAAAEDGLKYWKIAGTWLEEERAEYRLARSLLAAGRPGDAVASAQRCVAVCQGNAAPPFELFFGYAVLAQTQRAAGDSDRFAAARAQALQMFEQVPGEERRWCAVDLGALDA